MLKTFLKKDDPARCKASIYHDFTSSQCSKRAVMEYEGKAYCSIHDPVYRKAKQVERDAKRAAESKERSNKMQVREQNELVGKFIRSITGWSTDFPVSWERTLRMAKEHEDERNADLKERSTRTTA